MVKALILVLALSLSACATKVKYVTQTPPEPPVLTRPHLAIGDLVPGDTPDVVIRAHRESIQALMGYAKVLEEYLNAYRIK
jgi:hypothetical protein